MAAYFLLELSHKKTEWKITRIQMSSSVKRASEDGQGQNTLLYQLKTFSCDPEYISATGKRYYFIPTVLEPC